MRFSHEPGAPCFAMMCAAEMLGKIALIAGVWALFAVAVWLLRRAFEWVRVRLEGWRERLGGHRRLAGLVALFGRQLILVTLLALRTGIVAVVAVQFFALLTFSLGLFPQTAGLSHTLLGYLLRPFEMAWHAFVGYLPDLGVLIVVVLLTYVVIRALRLLAHGVEAGVVTLPGFHREWAQPTYEIVAFLAIVFGLVVAFPYLPGGDSPAFKGVSIFIGVLISLGSSSAISNIVAGVIITYMRPFQIGDRVKIADTIGDVTEKTLLVTRVRTIKNEEIIVPNSQILGTHIQNFSAHARRGGLILHTEVTIGYDAPWRKVHELLIDAAVKTGGILRTPAPFVLQRSLNDYHVSYEINAHTDQPNRMVEIYSELHANIQDAFNAAGVEIMSPGYTSLRDGNTVTIPAAQRPPGYEPPSFRVRGNSQG